MPSSFDAALGGTAIIRDSRVAHPKKASSEKAEEWVCWIGETMVKATPLRQGCLSVYVPPMAHSNTVDVLTGGSYHKPELKGTITYAQNKQRSPEAHLPASKKLKSPISKSKTPPTIGTDSIEPATTTATTLVAAAMTASPSSSSPSTLSTKSSILTSIITPTLSQRTRRLKGISNGSESAPTSPPSSEDSSPTKEQSSTPLSGPEHHSPILQPQSPDTEEVAESNTITSSPVSEIIAEEEKKEAEEVKEVKEKEEGEGDNVQEVEGRKEINVERFDREMEDNAIFSYLSMPNVVVEEDLKHKIFEISIGVAAPWLPESRWEYLLISSYAKTRDSNQHREHLSSLVEVHTKQFGQCVSCIVDHSYTLIGEQATKRGWKKLFTSQKHYSLFSSKPFLG